MNRATPRMRQLAERLMAHEAVAISASHHPSPPVFAVLEKLRPHLTTLMGAGGYRALLSRALALASAEAPWLNAAQVAADGRLGGFDKPELQVDAEAMAEAGVVLIAQMTGLLTAFIGEKLTLQLACEIWPALRRNICE